MIAVGIRIEPAHGTIKICKTKSRKPKIGNNQRNQLRTERTSQFKIRHRRQIQYRRLRHYRHLLDLRRRPRPCGCWERPTTPSSWALLISNPNVSRETAWATGPSSRPPRFQLFGCSLYDDFLLGSENIPNVDMKIKEALAKLNLLNKIGRAHV